MNGAFFTSSNFGAFLVAGVVLAIAPGPAVVYLVTQTLSQGRKGGLASVAGVAFGNVGNAAAASFGLAAVFALSSLAFTMVKLAGAGYLIFLGLRALITQSTANAAASARQPTSPGQLFRDGSLVALLNPKTALFFAAFLPQFIDPGASPLRQSLVFSGLFVTIAVCTDTVYVFTAAALASKLGRGSVWKRYGRYMSAASFLGLGIYAALANPQSMRGLP